MMFSALVFVVALYVVIFKKVLKENNPQLSATEVVSRQQVKVALIFFAPLLLFILTTAFSGGSRASGGEGEGAILWLYLPLIPGCGLAMISLLAKKRALRKKSEQHPQ